jgi:hypothetical protein
MPCPTHREVSLGKVAIAVRPVTNVNRAADFPCTEETERSITFPCQHHGRLGHSRPRRLSRGVHLDGKSRPSILVRAVHTVW